MIDLYWTDRECGAVEALEALAGVHTVLVSTPTGFVVAVRGADGALRTRDADAWPLPDDCFQLSAFDGLVELRWLASGSTGTAVWLAEDPAVLPGPPREPIRVEEVLADRSVLWGLPADRVARGFSTWTDGRVTPSAYPTRPGVTPHERACLDAVEYVAHDEHGNAHVVERRLVGITTVNLNAGRR